MALSPSTNMNFCAKAPLNFVAERVKNSVPPVVRTLRFCKCRGAREWMNEHLGETTPPPRFLCGKPCALNVHWMNYKIYAHSPLVHPLLHFPLPLLFPCVYFLFSISTFILYQNNSKQYISRKIKSVYFRLQAPWGQRGSFQSIIKKRWH